MATTTNNCFRATSNGVSNIYYYFFFLKYIEIDFLILYTISVIQSYMIRKERRKKKNPSRIRLAKSINECAAGDRLSSLLFKVSVIFCFVYGVFFSLLLFFFFSVLFLHLNQCHTHVRFQEKKKKKRCVVYTCWIWWTSFILYFRQLKDENKKEKRNSQLLLLPLLFLPLLFINSFSFILFSGQSCFNSMGLFKPRHVNALDSIQSIQWTWRVFEKKKSILEILLTSSICLLIK